MDGQHLHHFMVKTEPAKPGDDAYAALLRGDPNFGKLRITATTTNPPNAAMDLQEIQNATVRFLNEANAYLERIPGSSIAVRYIKSSYQNDPVRSAVELFLFLFAVRYLLAPKYSTQKKVQLTDAVCSAPWIQMRGCGGLTSK